MLAVSALYESDFITCDLKKTLKKIRKNKKAKKIYNLTKEYLGENYPILYDEDKEMKIKVDKKTTAEDIKSSLQKFCNTSCDLDIDISFIFKIIRDGNGIVIKFKR